MPADSRYRVRVVEMVFLPARELLDNAGNWRVHPGMQRDALTGILEEVGVVDALLAYRSARAGDALVLVDGHLRKDIDPDQIWPVLITDLDDDEADKILLTIDPIAALAETNKRAASELADNVLTGSLALREMIRKMTSGADPLAALEEKSQPSGDDGPPEMALQPFEHYDYVLLVFKTTFDWERALDTFGIERTGYTARTLGNWDTPKKRKVGVGRVLDGAKVLDMIQAAREGR